MTIWQDRNKAGSSGRSGEQASAMLAALSRSQAVIEFSPDGNVLKANENFCRALGYSLDEIVGRHHSMFVDPAFRQSPEYRSFWERLNRGEFVADKFLRIAKGGREIWIQASYNPVLDSKGKLTKIVKFATDVTEQENKSLDDGGQLAAISKSQAVIEFSVDGKVLNANENFCRALGYRIEEIRGQHHSMFVDPAARQSPEYRAFWERLGRGEYDAGQYKRIGKGGREIWIQASYNPILNHAGKPTKVVKYATDITEQVNLAREATFKSAAFEGSAIAMMMVDRDLKVTFVNEATKQLLKENVSAFRALWPSFNPDTIIGSCIDMFHKNPSHQRQLLSDPSRLPYRTDISVGDLKFALNVSAVYDSQRRYVGNVLQWDNVTATRMNAGMLQALGRAQAIIEFNLDGTITNANENFCRTLGYSLDEIKGKHHSMFVDNAYRQSADYRGFWEALGRGEFQSAKYMRLAKGGREIWIQASYNPIVDGNGKPFKIVKFATDVTQVENDRKAAEAERAERAAEQNVVVTSLASGLTQLAEGNLVTRLTSAFAPEYEKLRNDFNEAMTKVETAIQIIAQNAEGIRTGAGEISTAADDLSRRTEQQAASLEETAAALDEITATVKKTASGASNANTVVTEARGEAEHSGEVVRQAVSAMSEIERSAHQISQIIGVIDEIAFQTNLLALNAGVEAARAGEAGRGFAVVASEVRALAQRSSDAAKEIKALISASSRQVETGVELVNATGDALRKIVAKVEDINRLMAEITSSTQEQSTALAEVNTAINQMDQVTQQNAAMVEESTAASHSLAKEAEELARLVASFKVSQAASRAPKQSRPQKLSVAAQQKRLESFAVPSNGHANGHASAAARKQVVDVEWEDF